jgi:hypothetical protein
MEKKLDNADRELIHRIIDEEIASALEAFREGGFETTVRKGFLEEQERPRRRFIRCRRPAFAGLLGLAALFVTAVLILRPPRSSFLLTADDVGALLSILDKTTGAEILSGAGVPLPDRREASPDPRDPFVRLLGSLRDAGSGLEPAGPPGPAKAPAPRLSFREKIRVLYRDKVIERALLAVFDKTKEV